MLIGLDLVFGIMRVCWDRQSRKSNIQSRQKNAAEKKQDGSKRDYFIRNSPRTKKDDRPFDESICYRGKYLAERQLMTYKTFAAPVLSASQLLGQPFNDVGT